MSAIAIRIGQIPAPIKGAAFWTILPICGSARNDSSCAGANSKSFRLLSLAREPIEESGAAGLQTAMSPERVLAVLDEELVSPDGSVSAATASVASSPSSALSI